DNEDYYLDLLFYHRRLHRLVAMDIKLGKLQAADKGQMELYVLSRDRNNKYYSERRIMPRCPIERQRGHRRAIRSRWITGCPEPPRVGHPGGSGQSRRSYRDRSSPASAPSCLGWHAGTSGWSRPARGPATARSRCYRPRGGAGSWRPYDAARAA